MAVDSLADAEVSHVVILVPGIRDFGYWKKRVARELEVEVVDGEEASTGITVAGVNIGYFNVLQFLAPVSFFRQAAFDDIDRQIRAIRKRFPNAQISFIAHSFGSFCVANILSEAFDRVAHRVIFCGSVVPFSYPFEQISERFSAPILNDVGTSDPWPAMADAVTFGYGNAGTYGFGDRAYVTDRFHNGKGHGLFFEGEFARKYWLPFLRDGIVVAGDVPVEPAPLCIKLMTILKPKYLLAAVILLALLFFSVKAIYPATPFVARATAPISVSGSSSFYPWSGMVDAIVTEGHKVCPWGTLNCPPEWLQPLLWGRSFSPALQDSAGLRNIVTCEPVQFPEEGVAYDPFAAIDFLHSKFPECTAVTRSGDQVSWLPTIGEGHLQTRAGDNHLFCRC